MAAGPTVGVVLSNDEVERFVTDGAVRLDAAFPAELARECRELLWSATGCDEHDPSTWTQPVIRIDGRADAPFVAAANTERLRTAFDQLAGVGRWSPLGGLGTFPIRFPIDVDPGDNGWHIEATGVGRSGHPVVDPASRERVLLLLFLLGDVGPDDAPTRIRRGSHLVAARRLYADGPRVTGFFRLGGELDELTADRPEAVATGRAGDVWLCHPFLVHAAQRHRPTRATCATRGSRVRFLAQPPLPGTGPIDPARADPSPVEQAVARALD